MKKLLLILTALLSVNSWAANVNLQDVVLKDLNLQDAPLKNYQGKPVYIKMWASWCPICLATLAEADDLSADKNKDFFVVTIVSPTQRGEKPSEKFVEWFKGLGYKNLVVLLDEKGEVLKRAEVKGYPTNLLLDKDLNITEKIPGYLSPEKLKMRLK